jgi:ribosome-associated protein
MWNIDSIPARGGTDSGGRNTGSGDVMTEAEFQPASEGNELAPGVTAPAAALRWQFARSSGPGGQNVNKVNSKAELWLAVGAIVGMTQRAIARLRTLAGKRLTGADEIHIAADTERTQEANRSAALERLRELLVKAMYEPKPRRKTKPSRASKQRRLDSKKRRSKIKANRRGAE